MEHRGSPSDEDDNNDDEQVEEQKMSGALEDHEEIGGEVRRRRQLQQASRRSRKRQKRESMLCALQLSAVRSEIAEIKRQLDAAAMAVPDQVDPGRSAAKKIELEQRIAFLKGKLDAHQTWLQELRNLLAAAPLLDFALRMHKSDAEGEEKDANERSRDTTSADSYAIVDEWRKQVSGHLYSPILIAKHIHASVSMSQDNADKLLDEFNDPGCDFGVTFSSRGWSHAANVDDKLLTFRSSRVIPCATARTIAAAVWRSIQLDDILRTFVPFVQDAVVVYEAETPHRHVVERVVQFETTAAPEAMATIESMHEYGMDGTTCWRIVVETCDDPCLIAYASERICTASAQATTPGSPVTQGAGKNLSQRPDIVLAAKCSQQGHGVVVQFAGSIRHDGAWIVQTNSAVELVQFLVCMMPAYEELHLLSKT